jgi:hypothetical protein
MLPKHQGGKGLVDWRASKPEERLSHFDGVMKSISEPLGCRARNESKSEKCAEERAEIPAALPTGPIGEHVTGRGDFAVLHGTPLYKEVYIPIRMFAKSELWFQKSVICPPERSFAGLSNKTVNLEDHRQKH